MLNLRRFNRSIAACAVISLFSLSSPLFAQNEWRSWRGDEADGVALSTNVPSEWILDGPESNVRWRVPLSGPGNSSPIVSRGSVWITHFDPDSQQRQVLCFDAATGHMKWSFGLQGQDQEPTHPTNPYCAASPVTDGENVVAFLGSAGIVCLKQNGELLWKQTAGIPQHLFGQGASPVIHNGLVTVNYGPGTDQFWLTLDLHTGEEKWRLEIPKVDAPNPFDDPNGPKLPPGTKLRDPFGSWATAVVIRNHTRDELILANPKKVLGVDPQTGKVFWECSGTADQVFCSPVVIGEKICITGASAMLIETGGCGDVTESKRLWFREKDRPRIGTGVVVDNALIANDMQGILEAIDLSNGKRLWQERLSSQGGSESWSSLVRAGDRLFATNKSGTIFVFNVTPEFKLLGTNSLGETTNASPAIIEDRIFIRTDKHLWCIGGQTTPKS